MSEFLIARNLLLFNEAVFIVLKSDIFGQRRGNLFFIILWQTTEKESGPLSMNKLNVKEEYIFATYHMKVIG